MSNWIEQRRELYRHLRAHVEALLGSEARELVVYRRKYENEFKNKWKPTAREKLIAELQQSDILFMADFHALQQSQKAHLRLLKSLNVNKEKLLFVECIEAKYQEYLDSYLAGRISEKTFLKMIKWTQSWGFPWEHYKPLFDWAIANKIHVYALNLKKSLNKRDEFAAQIIAKVELSFPACQLIIIYGDLHLAKVHLPKHLDKIRVNRIGKKSITVFQNSEKIYFDLLDMDQELNVDVVQLSKNQFCLNSVPPWVKWQSYLLYVEGQTDSVLGGEEIDYTDHVEKYLKLLAEDFSIKVVSGSFSVYTANNDHLFEKLADQFSGAKLKWFVGLIESSRSFYCPEAQLAFLGRPSVNNAAHIAMAVLYSKLSGHRRSLLAMPNDFLRLIFIECLQYFGSKMVNPKRKTDTILDIKAALMAGGSKGDARSSLSLALSQKMQEILAISNNKSFKNLRAKKAINYYEAARLLGGMMGEKLYNGYRKNIISNAKIVKLLKYDCDGGNFEEFYRHLLKEVDVLPEAFQSKTEKM